MITKIALGNTFMQVILLDMHQKNFLHFCKLKECYISSIQNFVYNIDHWNVIV